MKKTLRLLAGSFVASLFMTAASAQDPLLGLYFRADAGGTWIQDVDLRDYFGVQSPNSQVEFNAGPRFSATVGYDIIDWFGIEGQLGVMANEIDFITDVEDLDAFLVNFPFMVNARLHFPTYYRVAPYIGAGVGGNSSVLEADIITVNGTSVEGSEVDTVFAWQAFAGLRFSIGQHMGVSLEYRYFESDGPSWRADDFGGGSDTIRFGNIRAHSVTAAFDWTF